MSELLIPFGIHRDSGEIVEPEDAAKGRACNCLCPGCKAPVLSRHPKEKRYHFAHDSKHELAKPEEECPFSSAVAVAMMIRELAPALIHRSINTPDYKLIQNYECCGAKSNPILVSKSATVKITDSSANVSAYSHHFDLGLMVGDYRIFVDLIYKGKLPVTLHEAELQEAKAAVLTLDCNSFLIASLKKNRSKRFSEAVTDFVLRDAQRRWRYHPRQVAKMKALREHHRCRSGYYPVNIRGVVSEPVPALMSRRKYISRPKPESKRYCCVLCGQEWVHHFTGPLSCPNGHSHLYAKELGPG
jgi:hypothetical protein